MSTQALGWLFQKEWRELLASRAYWLLLLMIGPLTGHAFITSVDTYAEVSGGALAQGLSPLDGIFVPTFGAYDLAVTLLFPFVAIRAVAAERDNGAWKLMLQGPASVGSMIAIKGSMLLIGWALAWIPGLSCTALWRAYGGAIYTPELWNLLLGYTLRVYLAAGIAVAAAAILNNASSAAIATLGVTVGSWALDFIAAGRGGWVQKAASYTPAAALRTFEQGQLRLNVVLVILLLGSAGFALAAVALRGRVLASVAVVAVAILAAFLASWLKPSWDLSENRRNSFSPSNEVALRRIQHPLHVTVYLAPEDPRLMDLDSGILSKLERLLPSVTVENGSHGRVGLFEGSSQHYGEVWYEMDGRRVMSRSTTEPIVLESLYQLARVPAPLHSEESNFPGHPLKASPAGAAWIFYGLWPVSVALAYWTRFTLRRSN